MAQEASKVASEATQEIGKRAAGEPPQRPLTGIPGFFSAFAKEVRKDISG